MPHDVFISYANEDKTVADAVCARLEANGIRCWIAPRDVPAGLPYATAIIDAIGTGSALVLVFTGRANQSRHVKREVDRALNRGLPILPFRVEDVVPSEEMEYYLAGQHWLDAITPPLEEHLDKLADSVAYLIRAGGAERVVEAGVPVPDPVEPGTAGPEVPPTPVVEGDPAQIAARESADVPPPPVTPAPERSDSQPVHVDYLLTAEPDAVHAGGDLVATVTSQDGDSVTLSSPRVLMSREPVVISLSPQSGIHVEQHCLPVQMSCGLVNVPLALVASLERDADDSGSADGSEWWLLELRDGRRFRTRGVDWPEVAPHLVGEGMFGEMSFPLADVASVSFEGGEWCPAAAGADWETLVVTTDEGVTFELACAPALVFELSVGSGALSAQAGAIGRLRRSEDAADDEQRLLLGAAGVDDLKSAAAGEWLVRPPGYSMHTGQCRAVTGDFYLRSTGWTLIAGPGHVREQTGGGPTATIVDASGARVEVARPALVHRYSSGAMMTYSEHTRDLDRLPLDAGNVIWLLDFAGLVSLSREQADDGNADLPLFEALTADGGRFEGRPARLAGMYAMSLHGSVTGRVAFGEIAWRLDSVVRMSQDDPEAAGEAGLSLPSGLGAAVTCNDGRQVVLSDVAAFVWEKDGQIDPRPNMALTIGGGEVRVDLAKLRVIEGLEKGPTEGSIRSHLRGTARAADGSRLTIAMDAEVGPCLVGRCSGVPAAVPFERISVVELAPT